MHHICAKASSTHVAVGCLVSAPRFLTFQIPLIQGINQGKRARKRDGSHFWNVRMDCGLLGVDSILTMRLHNQIRYPRASRVYIKFSSITFPQRLLLFPSPLVFHAARFVAVKSEKKYDKFMVIRRYLESVIAWKVHCSHDPNCEKWFWFISRWRSFDGGGASSTISLSLSSHQ